MTEPTKTIMVWGDYGPDSVTGKWSSNTYDSADATEYVPMADFQRVNNAALLGLQMAQSNGLWNTAETIKEALRALPAAQADYEARIRSALTAVPSPDVAGLVEEMNDAIVAMRCASAVIVSKHELARLNDSVTGLRAALASLKGGAA